LRQKKKNKRGPKLPCQKGKREMSLKFSFGWVCLLLSLLVWVNEAKGQAKIFDVKKYGAIADGVTDNSEVIDMIQAFSS
jgi:hypothetical protein